MVWQDMPSARPKDHAGVKRGAADDVEFTAQEDAIFRLELEALVRNLANAASIVAWVPKNSASSAALASAIIPRQ